MELDFMKSNDDPGPGNFTFPSSLSIILSSLPLTIV